MVGGWIGYRDRARPDAHVRQRRPKIRATQRLDGDAELASCIEQLPSDDDLDKARRKRQQLARHALATGGINARASELLRRNRRQPVVLVPRGCASNAVSTTTRAQADAHWGSTMPNGWSALHRLDRGLRGRRRHHRRHPRPWTANAAHDRTDPAGRQPALALVATRRPPHPNPRGRHHASGHPRPPSRAAPHRVPRRRHPHPLPDCRALHNVHRLRCQGAQPRPKPNR